MANNKLVFHHHQNPLTDLTHGFIIWVAYIQLETQTELCYQHTGNGLK